MLVVADEQVAEDAGLVEVAQADHVLHAVDGGRVHGLDVGGVLGGDPVFLREGGEDRRSGSLPPGSDLSSVAASVAVRFNNSVLTKVTPPQEFYSNVENNEFIMISLSQSF